MHTVRLELPWDADEWRMHARDALCAGVPPEAISWAGEAQSGLFAGGPTSLAPVRAAPRVSREFLSLIEAALCHRDPHRHGLLYRLLWRMTEGEAGLLERATDPDVHRARELEKSVRRDNHKMKAFVRFREVPGEDDAFVAWFEPQHYIVDRVAPFFARRFAGMRWAILTPYRSAWWDGTALGLGAGANRDDAPADDANEGLWRVYYANIFNPARLNPRMMRQEMAQKYWKHLPEAHLLPDLIRNAGPRVQAMAERMPQAPRRRIPIQPAPQPAIAQDGLQGLKLAVDQCRRCPLWEPATQAVMGEGPERARIMVVGEQPGDEEDLTGRPFIGPAGKLFNRVLDGLGIDREALYVTNVVKHFRFQQRGKLRMHVNPAVRHVNACLSWLKHELAIVRPEVVVCLGATAARAVLGTQFRLSDERGQWRTLAGGQRAFATVHPAAVLRQPAATREAFLRGFEQDLALLRGIVS
ncbi:UdgX family uracil-DNA binding protein [Lysobacter enzymogenes]|uniref:UdgX family uracil-DNA binding protein n=1 Tax=Lysobacter enzymogenes TaxID=69 RepID=UPI00384E093D